MGIEAKKIITVLPNLLMLRTAYQDGSCRREVNPQKKLFLIAADILMIFAPFNSNTFQAFIDLGLLKVSEVIKINQLKVEYNFYQKKVPDDLMSLFILSSSKHSTNHALNSAINNLIHIPSFDTVTHGSCTIQLGVILHLEISFHLFMYILTLIKITSRSSLTSSVCPACPCPPCTHPRTPILKKNY